MVGSKIAVLAIRRHWTGAVFENASMGDRYDQFDEIPLGRVVEIFVYRDAEAREAWDAVGAIPVLTNTMIQVLVDPGLMTLVFDEMDDWTRELVDTIRGDLEATP